MPIAPPRTMPLSCRGPRRKVPPRPSRRFKSTPVALDFDEDGRLYVAEFPEFNQNVSKQPHGHGHIRLLEDTDGDGVYDKSTIFLDNLDSPVAVCCYDGGVFVGVVPNI